MLNTLRNCVILIGLLVSITACAPTARVLPSIEQAPQLYQPRLEPDYRIQVGDLLTLRSYGDPDLNQEIMVRPDGRASILLIDEVVVAGLTTGELDVLVTDLYGPHVDSPEITVAVKKIASQSIYVGGEVQRPSMMALSGPMSLTQAITASGGVVRGADRDAIVLMRRDRTGAVQTYTVNLQGALSGQGDPYLRRDDVIYVPRTGLATAADWVDRNINGLIPRAVLVQFGYLDTDSSNPNVVVTPTATD